MNLTSPTRYDLLGIPTTTGDNKAFNAMAAGNYYPFPQKRSRDLLELQYQNMSNTLRIFGGIDFSDYKPATIMRRIERRMQVRHTPELYQYLDLLDNDPRAGGLRTLAASDNYSLMLVGRLKPGQTTATAEPGLKTLAARLRESQPVEMKDQTFTTRPLPRACPSPWRAM